MTIPGGVGTPSASSTSWFAIRFGASCGNAMPIRHEIATNARTSIA